MHGVGYNLTDSVNQCRRGVTHAHTLTYTPTHPSSLGLTPGALLVRTQVSRKYYGLRDLDIELWDHDDKWEDGHVWGISLIERHTACMCMGTSGVERDYIFPNKPDRDRFCVNSLSAISYESCGFCALPLEDSW